MKWKALVCAAPIASLLLAACDSAPELTDASGEAAEAVRVVASTTQICDYAGEIIAGSGLQATIHDAAGKVSHTNQTNQPDLHRLELTCLLAPNASAHDHEMTRDQMKALSEADLFLVNGVDLEHFLDDAIESSGFHGTLGVTTGVLAAADKDDLAKQEQAEKSLPYRVYRGEQKVDVAEWPFVPEPGEQAEFRFDPHVWTSPKNAKIQVANIGAALSRVGEELKVSEDFAESVRTSAQAFEAKLDALDAWVRDSLNTVDKQHRVLFTSHDAFGYLSKEYDIRFIGAALSDFNEQQDATAEHIRRAADQVKESGAVALFAENSNNSKSIEAIAEAAGVKAIIGDDALYGDSLGPAGSAGDTYIHSIEHNVTTLVNAWGGKPASLPKELS